MLGSPPGLPVTDRSDGEAFGRIGVGELPGGRVLGPHRAVITGSGLLVNEVSWYFGTTRARQHPLYLNPFPDAPMHVPGRLGVLAARGDGNYYHFLMDVLTKVAVLDQTRVIDRPDQWYAPAATRFQRELLELAGLTDVIDAAEHPHVQADLLVVPQPPAMYERNPPWAVAYLRALLIDAAPADPLSRRLYVTRGPSANNRTVRNEDSVLELLTRRGFEPVDPGAMSVREQIAAFASASVVVAPHGAALANLIFAGPGSAVIELFPSGAVLPDFWRLASGVPGLTYRYLSSWGGPRRPTRAQTIVRDIDVDLAELTRMLDDLGVS